MSSRAEVVEAIRASWSVETSAVRDEWTPENPSRGQCDVSALVLYEHCGGDLVLAEVFVDGEQTEHHYWNRIDGEDIDVTSDQFVDGEELRIKQVLPESMIAEKMPTMRDELRARVDLLRTAVQSLLD